MKITLKIPGVPIAKARPRFSRLKNRSDDQKPGGVRTYNPKENEERDFANQALEQIRQQGYMSVIAKGMPLRVSCWFYMPIPASSTKKFRVRCLTETVYHVKKPDADNLVKLVKDALNRVAWHDDSQVAIVRGMKIYGAEPRTVVLIETLEEE